MVIQADRLIDGTGAAPISDAFLVIEAGLIGDVFEGALPEGRVPPGTETLDLRGCTVLPGLIDTHVHLNMPGDGSMLEVVVRETDGVLVATSTLSARRALDAGITTARDVGGARRSVFDARRALELGHGPGARILACGQPITITGGHTWYFGGEADGEEGLRLKVREMCKLGADFIKVMASGGGTVNTMSWLPSYSPRELSALVDEAHRQGRRITAHCLCAESTNWVVDAGFDGIEHGGFIVDKVGHQKYEPATADKVARAGIPVTSTLAVGGFTLRAMRAIAQRTPAEQHVLDRWLRMSEENHTHFRKMREAGVTWVAGTDAGWRFTTIEGLPLEFELMRQCGLTALEAITAGTGLAARICGIDDKVGTLKGGMIADVLAVAGNPLDDLSRLGDLRLVMQAGRIHSLAA